MKKKLSVVVLLCFLFSLLCGCTKEMPEFLPGEHEGDENYVWVCKEPFAFMFSSETYSNEEQEYFEAYFEKEGRYLLSLISFSSYSLDGFLKSPDAVNEKGFHFLWSVHYSEEYFDLTIMEDYINFFNGELPTLRFEKMTKEEFKKEYGKVKNITVFD